MKREGFHHRKVRGLARLLRGDGRENPFMQARAALDGLWFVTATHAPRGDVGRCSDEEIADLVGWERAPAELIAALTTTQWLDPHPTYRLLVHDWSHHADKHVHRAVLRTLEHFVDGARPRIYEGTDLERLQWMELHVPRCRVCSALPPRAPRSAHPRRRVPARTDHPSPTGYPARSPPGTSLSLSQSHKETGYPAGYPAEMVADRDPDKPLTREETAAFWAAYDAEQERKGKTR
jgi:hypothetical protein